MEGVPVYHGFIVLQCSGPAIEKYFYTEKNDVGILNYGQKQLPSPTDGSEFNLTHKVTKVDETGKFRNRISTCVLRIKQSQGSKVMMHQG